MKSSRIALAIAIAAILAAGVAAASPVMSLGVPDTGDHAVNRQSWAATQVGQVYTIGDGWQRLPGSGVPIVARDGMTVTFSGSFRGAPVELRALSKTRGGETHRLKGGVATFNPSQRHRSFSYTWAKNLGPDEKCRSVWVAWRSPTGETVHLHEVFDVVVTYHGSKYERGECPT